MNPITYFAFEFLLSNLRTHFSELLSYLLFLTLIVSDYWILYIMWYFWARQNNCSPKGYSRSTTSTKIDLCFNPGDDSFIFSVVVWRNGLKCYGIFKNCKKKTTTILWSIKALRFLFGFSFLKSERSILNKAVAWSFSKGFL